MFGLVDQSEEVSSYLRPQVYISAWSPESLETKDIKIQLHKCTEEDFEMFYPTAASSKADVE